MSVRDAVEVSPGQSWAIRDDRYEGWRYVTVQAVEGERAVVRRRHAGRLSRIALSRFRSKRFTLCGYDGPGVLPPYKGSVANACGNCPPKSRVLPLMHSLSVGFGATTVTRDGQHVWATMGDTRKRLAHVELWARETPGDWRVRIDGPLSEELYQRHPNGEWVLVWRGFGFA